MATTTNAVNALNTETAQGHAHRSLLDDAVPDVSNLIEFHAKETGSARGRRRPDIQIVSRSAVVMTCAYWEAFCEDLAAEALQHLAEHTLQGTALPKELKKSLKRSLLGEQDELAIWSLADDGWRTVLRSRAQLLVSDDDTSLNTPKSRQVKEFFQRNVGMSDITKHWCWHKNPQSRTTKRLDEFVTLRGSIAHRGSPQEGVHKRHATDGLDLIQRLAAKSATAVNEFLVDHTGSGLPKLEPVQL
ncbi:HEPN domain-containing protein [Allosalinactinospora lopnorensis]|uniref:HEPN domain-containing protein n=1 Tax=Allosalinactinospora lopnorensis TaxID=1352348 RepID=UPI000A7C34CD|nr:HEPN domain-containing protein [Allosalinactinospora lopnorensis]